MKTKVARLCVLLIAFGFATVAGLQAAEHTKDSLKTVKERLKKKKAVLIDVRELREWTKGHLRDAQLVPLSELRNPEKLKAAVKKLPKDKIIYCHCRSGGRALIAAPFLKKAGFDIRPLKHGFADLIKAGFPKAKPKKRGKDEG
jgi:rhodanese-related sulfurtransferase